MNEIQLFSSPEFGEIRTIRVLDTCKNGKQVPTFRYNKAGVEKLRELIGGTDEQED